ncbi:MAG: glycosyltransferase family 2 protein [Gemmatimonadetes bacterium]|nr:MAG: glycosyltransferase family 2 protein [Gemmatimonadota bacterium]
MTPTPKVSIVVLTWNDKANVLECLESLSQVDYPNLEVIVSDNGSTDGSIEAIRATFPNVILIENGENLKFSRGNNVGIQYALEHGADYVLLLNNDTIVDPHFITEMVEVGETDPTIGMLGPKIYYHTEPNVIWYAGGEISLWKGLAWHTGIREPDTGQFDEIRDVGYITGCALMVKRNVIEKIGMLDPTYVAYAEDSDFSLRAHRAGYRLVYVPSAKLWHKIGGAWGTVTRRKIWNKFKSHLILFRRYAPPLAWFTTIPLFFVLDGFRILFLIAKGKIRNT